MSVEADIALKETFSARHIGPDKGACHHMLRVCGLGSVEALIEETVPENIRYHFNSDLFSKARTESEALSSLKKLADKNKKFRSFLGQGYYGTVTPAVIRRNILENPGWYTQYTPYQAEISQGRLESLLNFQTMVSDLTGLEVANASLLDEATAAAEAMLLSYRCGGKGADTWYVSEGCHPAVYELVLGRAEAVGIRIIKGAPEDCPFGPSVFGILLAWPNTDGSIEDYRGLIRTAHQNGAMVTMATDLLALTMLASPGELGADIAVGNSQRFGVPLGFGGPHAAFFATREQHKRQIPGRVVGLSRDREGRPAYRLALQTREQHIRREKATSNICTAQALLANMAAMYAVWHGPEGLRRIASRVHAMAKTLERGLGLLGWKVRNCAFFDTILVECDPGVTKRILYKAQQSGINLRSFLQGGIGISLDETCTTEDLKELWAVFAGDGAPELCPEQIAALCCPGIPDSLKRRSDFLSHPVFNRCRSETEMMRYIHRLEKRDLSLTHSMIPLGSCTMKLNAASELEPVSWPGFADIHPMAPLEQVRGYLEVFQDLERMLALVTGYEGVSLQPNSGAQGEYAGLMAIRAWHESRGQGQRNICLIPTSAHGTNPASARLAGMKVVAVNCDKGGGICLQDLKEKLTRYRQTLSAIMVTYPSTHGVFEQGIREVCALVHQAGGQVYLDGANLNAQIGLCAPGQFGADVSHLNLHKTFCIPHGGGGPGVGPVAVKRHLVPFLPPTPLDQVGKQVRPVSGAPWGSAGILPVSWMYLKMMGARGLKEASQIAMLTANYIVCRLDGHYPVLYKGVHGRVAHECIIDLRPFRKSAGIEVSDIAKRLMDYGFHAPTMAFPVAGTMMIEPTESESLEEINRFCEALLMIRDEIRAIEEGGAAKDNNLLKNAPHTQAMLCADHWDQPYSREEAAFPVAWLRDNKFWPHSARVDEAWGDRNFCGSCRSPKPTQIS